MNYELAKRLKEAGFPHKEASEKATKLAETCYIPTLSKLIDACGDAFVRLERTVPEREPAHTWLAVGRRGNPTFSTGFTPEEAVANLWLALNKKDAQTT